jgi:ribonuclease PH
MAYQRKQGRAADALRPLTITRGYTKHAQGAVLICFGGTKVLCTASVEDKVPPHKRCSGEGWVTAEYGMLPRATHSRSDREAARGRQTARTQEIQRLIAKGKLTASPIMQPVAAISVGIVEGTPLLDLQYTEDAACDTDMNVVMTGAGHFVEVQGTDTGVAFTRAEMDQLLSLADKGMRELICAQAGALTQPLIKA